MNILQKSKLFFFIAIFSIISSCAQKSENTDEKNFIEENSLISKIQESVDKYFAIKDEGEFIKSTFVGEYSEAFVGHLYEFVITKAEKGSPEFNYLAKVTYDEKNKSIDIVQLDFFILENVDDVPKWIEKRLQLNDAKKVD